MRAILVAKDGLDPIQVQRRAGPVDQRLEDLLHLPAGAEQQIPAVLHLKHGVLILKPALFLFCQIQRKTQAGTINPTLTELAQSPCSLLLRQGVCDLGQADGVAYGSEAVLVFSKFDPRLVRLRCHIFVPVQDHLRAEGRMPAHLDRHMPPVGVQDMKGIMIHVGPGFFGRQVAELTGPRLLRFPNQRWRLGYQHQK